MKALKLKSTGQIIYVSDTVKHVSDLELIEVSVIPKQELPQGVETTFVKPSDKILFDAYVENDRLNLLLAEKNGRTELAYSLVASMITVCQRKGLETNWEGLEKQLKQIKILEDDLQTSNQAIGIRDKEIKRLHITLRSRQYDDSDMIALLEHVVKDIENGDVINNPKVYFEQYKNRSGV